MASLTEKLSETVGAVFAACGLPPEFGRVKVSDRADLAQFQCNGAMMAAKAAKKPPREIAQRVADRLKEDPTFTKVELAGPGFINLDISDSFLAAYLSAMQADDGLAIPRAGHGTIILDYGGPNVAKPMHIGHLRSSIIGETLKRICRQAGYTALGDIHLGDWGTQMGMIIAELRHRHPGWPYFDPAHAGAYPAQSPVTLEDLESIYPAASKSCKEDPARMEEARAVTAALQAGDPGFRALWRHFVDVSIAAVKENLAALHVSFDLWLGESDAHDTIAPMVEELKAKGFAVESEGAVVIPVAGNADTKELPPLILYKSDGAVMYGTTDLATLADRVRNYSPVRIAYVVDQRQALHFEQLFRAARLTGIAPERTELIHAGFGTMNGTDGKPFKTREGGVMKLGELIGMAVEKGRQRLAEAELAAGLDEAEKEEIARKVGIAAIKFADLQNQRQQDYVFDLDRMTAFEGKTGPYILYQIVRIRSLLRKAEAQGDRPGAISVSDGDRALALLLTELPDAFELALRNLMPHYLCDYAYRVAQQFSSFYGSCHILSEPDAALRASRLGLCALAAAQLGLVLDLLGIEAPEQM
jgi:arginyl-tRNA synthetase